MEAVVPYISLLFQHYLEEKWGKNVFVKAGSFM
jgi:hypothetical protein